MGTRDEMLKAQLEGESNKAELDNRQSGLGCQLELVEEHWLSIPNQLAHGSTAAERVELSLQF